jgi:hypothetical protein
MDTAIFRGNDYGDRYLRQVATEPKNRGNQPRRSGKILFTAPIGSSSFTNPEKRKKSTFLAQKSHPAWQSIPSKARIYSTVYLLIFN